MNAGRGHSHQPQHSISTDRTHDRNRKESIGGPSYEAMARLSADATIEGQTSNNTLTKPPELKTSSATPPGKEQNAGVLDALPALPVLNHTTPGNTRLTKPHHEKSEAPSHTQGKTRPRVARRPRTTPVLLPEHRYCAKDEIVKPYRTHHCRSCGTVSLQLLSVN